MNNLTRPCREHASMMPIFMPQSAPRRASMLQPPVKLTRRPRRHIGDALMEMPASTRPRRSCHTANYRTGDAQRSWRLDSPAWRRCHLYSCAGDFACPAERPDILYEVKRHQSTQEDAHDRNVTWPPRQERKCHEAAFRCWKCTACLLISVCRFHRAIDMLIKYAWPATCALLLLC